MRTLTGSRTKRVRSAGGGSSARALADQLAHIPIAAIYSSPARRAPETIEPLARHLQLQPVILMDVRERELSASTAAEFHAAVAASWKEPDVPFRNGGDKRLLTPSRLLAGAVGAILGPDRCSR